MLSNAWKEAIKNPDLQDLTSDALRNYRVCNLHFTEDSYTITSNHRVLRNNAVPTLYLLNQPTVSTECLPASTAFVEVSIDLPAPVETYLETETSTSFTPMNDHHLKIFPTWKDVDDIHKSQDLRKEIVEEIPKINRNNKEPLLDIESISKSASGWNILPPFIEDKNLISANVETTFEAQNQENGAENLINMPQGINADTTVDVPIPCLTPKTSKKRPLLGSITRKSKLTSIASN